MSIFSASIAGTPGSVTDASHAIDGASVAGQTTPTQTQTRPTPTSPA